MNEAFSRSHNLAAWPFVTEPPFTEQFGSRPYGRHPRPRQLDHRLCFGASMPVEAQMSAPKLKGLDITQTGLI